MGLIPPLRIAKRRKRYHDFLEQQKKALKIEVFYKHNFNRTPPRRMRTTSEGFG